MPKKTITLSARAEDPSRLSVPAELSRLAIAYLNTRRALKSHPTRLISWHSYYCSYLYGGQILLSTKFFCTNDQLIPQ